MFGKFSTHIGKLAVGEMRWPNQDYVGQTLLQEAVRNHGRVDLMEKKNGEKLAAPWWQAVNLRCVIKGGGPIQTKNDSHVGHMHVYIHN